VDNGEMGDFFMNVKPVKTKPINVGDDLIKVLDESISKLDDGSIVVFASTIISLCEGRVVKMESCDKHDLIEKEAEYFLPPSNKYGITLTIKNFVLIPSAGIDESNTNGYYAMWPSDPQESANKIRLYLKERFGVGRVGVVIADSKTTPLRWGVTNVAISHSGFAALNDYEGKADIFGRVFAYEKANIADSLAAAAGAVMGEGDECVPIVVIDDVPFVNFQDRNPSKEELDFLKIDIDTDLYGEILGRVNWKRGGGGKK